MSSFRHPDDGLLLALPRRRTAGRKSRQVRRHLEACWQCRGELEELEGTVAECVRYRKQVRRICRRRPSRGRTFPANLPASMRRSKSEPFWKRYLTFPMLRQAAAGAAVLALLMAVIYQFQKAPAVQAAMLLKRAVAAETIRPRRVPQNPHSYRVVRDDAHRGSPSGFRCAHAGGHREPVRGGSLQFGGSLERAVVSGVAQQSGREGRRRGGYRRRSGIAGGIVLPDSHRDSFGGSGRRHSAAGHRGLSSGGGAAGVSRSKLD